MVSWLGIYRNGSEGVPVCLVRSETGRRDAHGVCDLWGVLWNFGESGVAEYREV